MAYKIKEIFYSLQGEGAQAGRPAIFCRFTGCNLWTGREEDRQKAICQFCDTDFIGMDGSYGGKYTAEKLATKMASLWPKDAANKLVICTGGEPLLQLDEELIAAFHSFDFEVAVETNGTVVAPKGIDWLCVSPKAGTEILLTKGDELKLVYPQEKAPPELFVHLDFSQFFLQPMYGENTVLNTKLTLQYCLQHPQWRMSLQLHKILDIE